MIGDTLTVEGDPTDGTPLLEPVMRHGKRIKAQLSLSGKKVIV
jgi:hypothetical protein